MGKKKHPKRRKKCSNSKEKSYLKLEKKGMDVVMVMGVIAPCMGGDPKGEEDLQSIFLSLNLKLISLIFNFKFMEQSKNHEEYSMIEYQAGEKLYEGVYRITNGDNYILYFPLENCVFEANPQGIALIENIIRIYKDNPLQIRAEMINIGLDLPPTIASRNNNPDFGIEKSSDFKPIGVRLLPTSNCNLKCVYCYSHAGEKDKVKNMPWEIARSAIDLVIGNAMEAGSKNVYMDFHGGGEPTSNMKLLKAAVNYFRKQSQTHNLISDIKLITNAANNPKNIRWLTENIDELTITFDGPDGQTLHRSFKSGQSSEETVIKNLEFINQSGIPFNIETIVSEQTVCKIPQIAKFNFERFKNVKSLSFAPVINSGRARDNGIKSLHNSKFLKYITEAFEIGKNYGKNIIHTVTTPNQGILEGDFRCGAVRPSFIVTPTGLATSCLEIDSEKGLGNTFIYGNYIKDKGFVFDTDKLNRLIQLRTKNSICEDCFASYECGGGCSEDKFMIICALN